MAHAVFLSMRMPICLPNRHSNRPLSDFECLLFERCPSRCLLHSERDRHRLGNGHPPEASPQPFDNIRQAVILADAGGRR